jgi:hypothetical protein
MRASLHYCQCEILSSGFDVLREERSFEKLLEWSKVTPSVRIQNCNEWKWLEELLPCWSYN